MLHPVVGLLAAALQCAVPRASIMQLVMAPLIAICLSLPTREPTSTLMTLERSSFPAGCTGALAEVLCDPKLWMVHACLALLGGAFPVRQLLCWS